MTLSGYVPFHNNAQTVLAAVDSLRRQTAPVDDVFAVDDGSTDDGAKILENAGVRVLRQPGNLGRGAARARAMESARHEGVVCCDATNILPERFAEDAARWLENPKVAAAFGRITQKPGGNAVTRWRGRHLFKIPAPGAAQGEARRCDYLATYGAVVRRSAVLAVGNYDRNLRHTEDADLGCRLSGNGWEIVMDPTLEAVSIARNTLFQVLERHWRWHAGKDETVCLRGYVRSVLHSLRVMAAADLREGDVGSALISLYSPHFQFWRSVMRKTRTRQTAPASADDHRPRTNN